MNAEGWIKLHRKLLDNPVTMKDTDHLAVWIYLLLNASHNEHPALFKGEKITLKPGQLITGRKSIALALHIDESKVERILKSLKSEQQIEQQTSSKNRLISITNWEFYQQSEQQIEQQVNNKRTKSEQQIEQQTSSKNRLISITNWEFYQQSEQQIEQQVNNKRTTSEQQVNTNKNIKNDKNERKDICQNILDLFNRICCSFGRVKNITKSRAEIIDNSLKTYSLDDFKEVFKKAEQSDFLKGNNSRSWSASFDWLIKEDNMAKVLEGKYDKNKQSNKFCDFPQRQYDFSNDKELIIKNC